MKSKKMFALAVLLCSLSGLAACSSGSSGLPPVATAAPTNNGGSNQGQGSGPAPTGTGTAVLAWSAPTTNTDGSALTNLAGYKVSYGTASGDYTKTVDVGAATTYSVADLGPGTWYFAVMAYSDSGSDSNYSNEITKTVQ